MWPEVLGKETLESQRKWKKSQRGKSWKKGFLQFCAWNDIGPEPASKLCTHRTDPKKKIAKPSRNELPYKPLPRLKINPQEAHVPDWTEKHRKGLKTELALQTPSERESEFVVWLQQGCNKKITFCRGFNRTQALPT